MKFNNIIKPLAVSLPLTISLTGCSASENDLSQKLGNDYNKLGNFLVTGENEVKIKDGMITIPSFSIAILNR